MIVCAAGLIIGVLAGLRFDPGFWKLGCGGGLMVFMALADSLVEMLSKKSRGGGVGGLAARAAFCAAVFWIEARTGAPVSAFAVLVMMVSIYRRVAAPGKTAAGAK